MSAKPFSSFLVLRGRKYTIKLKGPSVSAPGSGSSVRGCDFYEKQFDNRRSTEEFLKVQDRKNHNKTNNNGSSPSTLEESSPVPADLSSSHFESRLKKEKRGRENIGEAEETYTAAQTLMYMHLYGNNHLCHRLPSCEPKDVDLLPVKKIKNKEMKNHVGGSYSSPAAKKSLGNCKEKLEGSDGNEELEAKNNMWETEVIRLVRGKNNLEKKVRSSQEMIKSKEKPLTIRTVEQEEVKRSQGYVCDVCNKSFTCFQALGGHKTKHRAKRMKVKLEAWAF